ncbi:MAG: hypothetical protein M3N13_01190 [Candidatus Eremiobacteraeota bacterium]|nr:hypothetical protein [Candidatus Eremiobacteraeota bacterium]
MPVATTHVERWAMRNSQSTPLAENSFWTIPSGLMHGYQDPSCEDDRVASAMKLCRIALFAAAKVNLQS